MSPNVQAHCMSIVQTPKQKLIHRLRICAGHLAAVQKQLEQNKECLEIVHQLRAIEHALKKVELILIQTYLLEHSKSPEELITTLKLLASSSLHLPTSKIHQ
jgi:DNA-binding FrmR family transcriptional regulator